MTQAIARSGGMGLAGAGMARRAEGVLRRAAGVLGGSSGAGGRNPGGAEILKYLGEGVCRWSLMDDGSTVGTLYLNRVLY